MTMTDAGTSGTVPGSITASGLIASRIIGSGVECIGTILPIATIIIIAIRLSIMNIIAEEMAVGTICAASAHPQAAGCNAAAVDMAGTVGTNRD